MLGKIVNIFVCIEPHSPASVPMANGMMPPPRADADPEDEPPG
jgi:hypothetical protein